MLHYCYSSQLHTDQTEKLIFTRTGILGLIALISTYLTNLPHRQLMWETWLIQSNELYTKFHATQWYGPVFALFTYKNMRQTVGTVNW